MNRIRRYTVLSGSGLNSSLFRTADHFSLTPGLSREPGRSRRLCRTDVRPRRKFRLPRSPLGERYGFDNAGNHPSSLLRDIESAHSIRPGVAWLVFSVDILSLPVSIRA